jgi:hypothetical protein
MRSWLRAKSLGIAGDDKAVLEGLRSLPAEKLTEATDNYVLAIFGGPEIAGLSHSIIDGRLAVEAPEAALRGGRQAIGAGARRRERQRSVHRPVLNRLW